MSKKQHIFHDKPEMASEPMPTYNVPVGYRQSSNRVSTNGRIMSNTMSVDEYFDKLISLVHDDYADV